MPKLNSAAVPRTVRRAMCRVLLSSALLCALVAVPLSTQGEIYRWTDASGQLHFAQDLSRVPPEHRAMAEAAAKSRAEGQQVRRIQTYSPPASRGASPATRNSAGAGSTGKIHKIRVQAAGSSMTANVLINGRVRVPFHLDTGASDVVLPKWAAEELGLDLSNARTGVYGTANGTVTQKLVRLDSVALGGAEVRDVPASISSSMKTGLLGLSFFNHFKYHFDPSQGLVTLQHNDLAESGQLRGGRSRSQWRGHFRSINGRIGAATAAIDEIPFSRTRQRDRAEQRVTQLERELALLEDEADDAKVPFAWRE